ncbi:MAG: hypothetical protein QXF59_02835 [Candidatus Bathyarchaeia archaeon]
MRIYSGAHLRAGAEVKAARPGLTMVLLPLSHSLASAFSFT